jgi:hypothetical protein
VVRVGDEEAAARFVRNHLSWIITADRDGGRARG